MLRSSAARRAARLARAPAALRDRRRGGWDPRLVPSLDHRATARRRPSRVL